MTQSQRQHKNRAKSREGACFRSTKRLYYWRECRYSRTSTFADQVEETDFSQGNRFHQIQLFALLHSSPTTTDTSNFKKVVLGKRLLQTQTLILNLGPKSPETSPSPLDICTCNLRPVTTTRNPQLTSTLSLWSSYLMNNILTNPLSLAAVLVLFLTLLLRFRLSLVYLRDGLCFDIGSCSPYDTKIPSDPKIPHWLLPSCWFFATGGFEVVYCLMKSGGWSWRTRIRCYCKQASKRGFCPLECCSRKEFCVLERVFCVWKMCRSLHHTTLTLKNLAFQQTVSKQRRRQTSIRG
jgi:hypothetical protein